MPNIVLCRIDSRLIHGQVMTKWIQSSDAQKIVIISNPLAADSFLWEISLMAMPPGIEAFCYDEDTAVKKWNDGTFGSGRILLLMPDVSTLRNVTSRGIKLEKIQIGGLGGGPDRKAVFRNITLDEKDVIVLKNLEETGVSIYFQTIPEDSPVSFKDIYNHWRKNERG